MNVLEYLCFRKDFDLLENLISFKKKKNTLLSTTWAFFIECCSVDGFGSDITVFEDRSPLCPPPCLANHKTILFYCTKTLSEIWFGTSLQRLKLGIRTSQLPRPQREVLPECGNGTIVLPVTRLRMVSIPPFLFLSTHEHLPGQQRLLPFVFIPYSLFCCHLLLSVLLCFCFQIILVASYLGAACLSFP